MKYLPELLSTVMLGNTSSRLLISGLRARSEAFQEQVLGHVIGGAHAVDRVGAEVLDAERAEIRADLEILGLDLGRLDLAARDLGLDDRGLAPAAPRRAPAPATCRRDGTSCSRTAAPPLEEYC